MSAGEEGDLALLAVRLLSVAGHVFLRRGRHAMSGLADGDVSSQVPVSDVISCVRLTHIFVVADIGLYTKALFQTDD